MTEPTFSGYLTLSQAARFTPAKVSPNALWRWCRQGVRSRGGDRIRLKHVRQGGRLFTTRHWLEEFGERLAAADTQHFAINDESASDRWEEVGVAPKRQPRRWRRDDSAPHAEHARRQAEVNAELDAEGL